VSTGEYEETRLKNIVWMDWKANQGMKGRGERRKEAKTKNKEN